MAVRSSGQVGEVVYGLYNPLRIGVIIGPATPVPGSQYGVMAPGGQPSPSYIPDVTVEWADGSQSAEPSGHLQSFDALVLETHRKTQNHLARRAALGRKVHLPPLILP